MNCSRASYASRVPARPTSLTDGLIRTSADEARKIVETNFLGTFLMTRALLPQLRRHFIAALQCAALP